MASLEDVRAFWNAGSCGEVYAGAGDDRRKYAEVSRARYELEPYLLPFARFEDAAGADALEIGVGMGSDHQALAEAGPRSLHGVDLTERAVEHTRARFAAFGLRTEVMVANAEALPFPDASFDFVYSWGVIHHSPDTAKAAAEILRVLRPGGLARVMIYHRRCPVGWMLWTRYALLAGRPWRSLDEVFAEHLESPGTKAYDVAGGKSLFKGARTVSAEIALSMGDLLEGATGQRHKGPLLTAARALWPRRLLRWLARRTPLGMCLLLEIRK